MQIYRKENHAHTVLARGRQREPETRRFALEKSVWNLDQNARSVAGLRIAAASSAMSEVDQNLNALEDDVVRLAALDIRNETDAAGIVFVLGPVQTLGRRQAVKWVDLLHDSRYLDPSTRGSRR